MSVHPFLAVLYVGLTSCWLWGLSFNILAPNFARLMCSVMVICGCAALYMGAA